MDNSMHDLYARYMKYVNALHAAIRDERSTLRLSDLPLALRARLDFTSFEKWWHSVCQERDLEERWTKRLENGYAEDAREATRAADDLHQELLNCDTRRWAASDIEND